MTTIVYLLASLLLGGLIGLGVYWPLRTTRRAYRIGAGIFFGFLAVLGSAIIFLYASFKYPGVDEQRFAGQSRIEVIREASLEAGAKSRVKVLIVFPQSVRKDYDFTVRLVTEALPALNVGDYKAVLTTAKSLEVRPTRTCQVPKSEEGSGIACAAFQGGSELELRWDVTPSSDGRPRFALSLPSLWLPSDSWRAHLRLGLSEPEEYVDPPCRIRRLWGGSRDSSEDSKDSDTECEMTTVVLNPQRPRYIANHQWTFLEQFSDGPVSFVNTNYDDVEVDLEANTISFPVEVFTTLGFSATTYGWLALVGTIISGMLGSGWIWKLLDTVRKRREASSSLASDT